MSNRFAGILIIALSVVTVQSGLGQVKIGDNPETIDAASLLELESTSRALVLSRVSDSEMSAINPLEGALVYNTDEKCIFYYVDDQWNNLCEERGGNDGTGGGNSGDGGISITEESEIIFTYINEDGDETIISLGEAGVLHVGSTGSVFFAGSDGIPTEDNDNFFWNNAEKKLGIGTSNPENELDVDGIIKASRAHIGRGSESYPGYHFQDNVTSGMFTPGDAPKGLAFSTAGTELMRMTPDQRVGINLTDPQATLHVGGDLRVDGNIIDSNGNPITGKNISSDKNAISAKSTSLTKNIRRLSTVKATLTETDHTLIIENIVERITMPKATASNLGNIYILKDLGGELTKLNIIYKNLENVPKRTTENKGTIWLQSDGEEWQQIN